MCLQRLVSTANDINAKLRVLDDAQEAGIASTVVEAVRVKTIEDEMNASIDLLGHTRKANEILYKRYTDAMLYERRTKEELIKASDNKRKEAILAFALATKAKEDAYKINSLGITICQNLEDTITKLSLALSDTANSIVSSEKDITEARFNEFAALVLAVRKQPNENTTPLLPPVHSSFSFYTNRPSQPPPSSFYLDSAPPAYFRTPEEIKQENRQRNELRKLR